ncbi:phage antirepressor KilAC domain-containing protein [Fusobacterium polymorphum]|uniref:phage antirepressor KilAC domain-containing protein n=1 Tax=Fusobacterium nucleatum subsp. polymorphum TaxID=76857 RepID=UPI001C6DFAA3|nr:phage antirepressor KilAC domain-containing protein [Fusobacterium polymorphum]QYR58887.1 phage antirepressor KilAC domain-containing protein [Fusobacterium polymorphum]
MIKKNNKNEIVTIKNVRGYIDEKGTAWLNLEDVARGLGFTQIKNKKEYIRWETVISYCNEFSQQVGKESFIPENVFYKLCMKANNEVARKFQDNVCDEILPSIRKYGMYATDELLDNPDLIIKMATRLKEEKAKNKELEDKMKEDKPKVLFAEAVSIAKNTILIREMAKLIKQNGIDMGERRLFIWLRENGYLIKKIGTDYNMPTQKSMDLGLFEIKESPVLHSSGEIEISKTPKVTGKGQQYFLNLFLKDRIA